MPSSVASVVDTLAHQLELVASLSDAALSAATAAGAREASARIEEIRTQTLVLRDGVVETTLDTVESGLGVRVIAEGSSGFAATVELGRDAAALVARQAIEGARLVAPARSARFELVDEPGHGEVEYSSTFRTDPTTVAMTDKIELLEEWSRRLLAARGVTHVTAELQAVSEFKHYADSSGTVARQRRVRIHPTFEVVAVADDGDFETMRTLAPPVGRGWEYLEGDGWDWQSELAALPELLTQKLAGPSV
ncbi:MAG: DNA gyrase modulator, partial [Acidimicrobiales bacterium]